MKMMWNNKSSLLLRNIHFNSYLKSTASLSHRCFHQIKCQLDNSPISYNTLETVPLSSALGAEIKGIQLSQLSLEKFHDIQKALYRHGMIFFRHQIVSHDDQQSLTTLFGEVGRDAYTKGIPGYPNITRVLKRPEDRVDLVFGGGWHTDSPFLKEPPGVSLLYGVDIPPYGGDTYWASSALAYKCLSPTMQSILQPLRTIFSAKHVYEKLKSKPGGLQLSTDAIDEMNGSISHPLVRTHPITGVKSLYMDQTYTIGFEGLTEDESAPLVKFLQHHMSQLQFTCRLRWEKNTFVIWDNRLTTHHAFNDYDGFRREMFRSTVCGGVPQ